MKKIVFSLIFLSSIFFIGSNETKADVIMPGQTSYGYCIRIKNISNGLEIYQESVSIYGKDVNKGIGDKNIVNENECIRSSYMLYKVVLSANKNGKTFKVVGIEEDVLKSLSSKHLQGEAGKLEMNEYVYRIGKITGNTVYVYKEKVSETYTDNTTKVLFSTTKNPYLKVGYERISGPSMLKNYKNLVYVNRDIYGIKKLIK